MKKSAFIMQIAALLSPDVYDLPSQIVEETKKIQADPEKQGHQRIDNITIRDYASSKYMVGQALINIGKQMKSDTGLLERVPKLDISKDAATQHKDIPKRSAPKNIDGIGQKPEEPEDDSPDQERKIKPDPDDNIEEVIPPPSDQTIDLDNIGNAEKQETQHPAKNDNSDIVANRKRSIPTRKIPAN